MREEEFGRLLRHIRLVAREQGFADLDQSALDSDAFDGPVTAERVIVYLTALRNQALLGGERVNAELMRRLRHVRTPDGSPISGVEIAVTESDVETYGEERIDLVGSPELDEWVADLDRFIAELRESQDQ